MSNFRKFTEFCAFLSAFTALMYVFREYMGYHFEDNVEGFKAKLKIFFANTATQKDYTSYLFLAALIILAILVSLIFKRLPELSFFFSALPFFFTIYLYDADKLYEKPMIFICLSILQITGNLYDVLKLSRSGRRYSTVFTSFVASALPLLVSLTVIWRAELVLNRPLPEKLYNFDRLILVYSDTLDLKLFKIIAIMYGIILLLSIILRGVHFIDLALSIVPLCFVIYKQALDTLGPHHEIIMAAAILCTVTHLVLTIGGNELLSSLKKKKAVKE